MRLEQIVVLCMVILIRLWCFSDACREDERLAFLQIRASFPIDFYFDKYGDIMIEDDHDWKRIECDANSGRVTSLFLDSAWSSYPNSVLINASLFLPFKQLRFLHLSNNAIGGCLENEGFERLEELRNLEYIDLSWNNFNKSILSSLSNLSSLKTLNISGNRLDGAIHVEELNKFKNLKELNMEFNEIEELVSFKDTKLRLKSLEILDLSWNSLSNNLFLSLEDLFNLKVLRVGYNQFRGSFNLTNLVGLRNLEELDLSGNENLSSFVTSKDFEDAPNLKTIGLDEATATMLKSLGTFPYIKSLKTLFLGRNDLTNTTFHKEFQSFRNVEEVHPKNLLLQSSH